MMTLTFAKTKGQNAPSRKSHRSLLLATGALLATASPALAQGWLRADASGHLDPARLPHDAAFHTLNISDQVLFAGPISLPAHQPVTLSGDDISGSILTIGAGGVFAPLALPIGQSIRRNAANTAFEPYVPNTGDGSALTNLNAAALGSGTVAPAHLGTGTPSSTTVLRGDGTWAATTSTGSTIASTTNLLVGDGAGNAAALTDDTALFRVLKARRETQQALVNASNVLTFPSLDVRNGTLNADRTITIPAHDYIRLSPGDGNNNKTRRYCYAVATTDAPVGTAGLRVIAFYGTTYQGAGFSAAEYSSDPEVFSSPLPGVAKYQFLNSVGAGEYTLYVENNSGAPVTVYLPSASTLDVALPVVESFAETSGVLPQPVADLDFTRFASDDRTGRYVAERQTTVAVDSVAGLDANAGTLYAPKLTLGQTLATGSVFGVYRGSNYRASLPLAGVGRGVVVRDLAFGSVKNLPVVSGLDVAVNSSFSPNGDGTYSFVWLPTDTAVANDGYNNVYVVEINTATEAATPVASRHRMVDANILSTLNSQSAVAARAGSAWIQHTGPTAGAWTAVIHPSDHLAPGSGSYRYEVVSRVAPAPWYTGNSFGDGSLSGFQLVGGSTGYGPLSGPTGFVGDRLIVAHGTTHNAVLGGGSLQRSVFYETPGVAIAWYANDPTGLSWDLRHCLFYGQTPGGLLPSSFILAHNGGGAYSSTAYTRGDMSDCAFLGGRLANGALGGYVFGPHNQVSSLLDRCYVSGVGDLFDQAFYAGAEVKRCVFRQMGRVNLPGSFHDNLVAFEPLSDPANINSRGVQGIVALGSATTVQNNLFWLRNTSTTGLTNDGNINFLVANQLAPNVTRNIVVLDGSSAGIATYVNFSATSTLPTLDYNLVIQTSGTFNNYGPGGGGSNPNSWAGYVGAAQTSTLDQHSLYVDLRGDPRGVKAVFVDPANGDFRWAQTEVARRCAAFCRANNVGPATVTSRWPVVPTVDEAVRLLTDL